MPIGNLFLIISINRSSNYMPRGSWEIRVHLGGPFQRLGEYDLIFMMRAWHELVS